MASLLAGLVKGWAPNAKPEDLFLPVANHAELIDVAGADFGKRHNLKYIDDETVDCCHCSFLIV